MTLASAFEQPKAFQGGSMRARILVVGVAAVLVAACGNAGSNDKSQSTIPKGGANTPISINPEDLKKNVPVTAKGVTDTEIQTTAIVTATNSPTGDFTPLADGINAYFKMINDAGGIYGRQLKLTRVRDDQLGSNSQAVQASLATDKAFATFMATVLFTGAKALARANQPTFIWNINPEFADKNNMFADKGALCFKCAGHVLPWVAKQLGATKIGIIAYGVSAESTDCADGIAASFKKFPTAQVVFMDKSLPFAAPLAAQVTAMKNRGVQFIGTCIDLGESFALGKEMKRQGMNAVQGLPNGYDPGFVAKNADVLENALVSPQFQAFEHQPQIPEITKMVAAFDKIGKTPSELGTGGWIIADEFVLGLKMAGPEFSQQKVIDALNTLKSYTSNGLIQPIDWTKQHEDPLTNPAARADKECFNYVKVQSGKFVPVFGEPGKPWVCFNETDPNVDNPQFVTFATG
jgi:ABC-type branched-subunit amino acid transport system substrate-binding protein